MYIVNLVTHSSNAKMYGSNVRMYLLAQRDIIMHNNNNNNKVSQC